MSIKILKMMAIVLIIAFYWFLVRPANIRKDCGLESALLYGGTDNYQSTSDFLRLDYEEFYDFYYRKCLNQHGLK